jgi:hypothetical protein
MTDLPHLKYPEEIAAAMIPIDEAGATILTSAAMNLVMGPAFIWIRISAAAASASKAARLHEMSVRNLTIASHRYASSAELACPFMMTRTSEARAETTIETFPT